MFLNKIQFKKQQNIETRSTKVTFDLRNLEKNSFLI